MKKTPDVATQLELKPGQSLELLKELHILTREGHINQDSRRKLKQIYHLYQFIEPLLKDSLKSHTELNLVDHGAGKSYLGFILYDLFFKNLEIPFTVSGIERRSDLVTKSKALADKLHFQKMNFLELDTHAIEQKSDIQKFGLPSTIQMVTALHACDTATDGALDFALKVEAPYVVLVPCCQAEVAQALSAVRSKNLNDAFTEIYRHPLHTREFGSHLTNVLRCLRLESYGYQVTVTEFTGLEHSMKNELILARKIEKYRPKSALKLNQILDELGLDVLRKRFSVEKNQDTILG